MYKKGIFMNSFISILDAFCACIASLTLIILSLKFVSKRLKFKKVDKFLLKIHKQATYALLITSILHGILSFRAFPYIHIAVYIFGILSILFAIASMITFFKRKRLGSKWVLYHGILGIATILAVILHLYFLFK